MINLDKGHGTYKYMCPEIIGKKNITCNGIKADIFSLGVLLFKLVTGKFCFPLAYKQDPFYKDIIKKNYKSFWETVKKNRTKKFLTEELKDLIYIVNIKVCSNDCS